jgi:predicted peptidase
LKGKSKNIKTAAKQRIKRQKTPNKLTSKTPLEPASSSTVNKNVLPEDDQLWDGKFTAEELGYKLYLPTPLSPYCALMLFLLAYYRGCLPASSVIYVKAVTVTSRL